MAFHSQYNAQFYAVHPNIYVFIDVLNKLQANTYVKIVPILYGEQKVNTGNSTDNCLKYLH